MQSLITKFHTPDIVCTTKFDAHQEEHRYRCDAMMLGSLLKSANIAGIYPVPSLPFAELSFHKSREILLNLDIAAFCDDLHKSWTWSEVPVPTHGAKQEIRKGEEAVETSLSGLALDYSKAQTEM